MQYLFILIRTFMLILNPALRCLQSLSQLMQNPCHATPDVFNIDIMVESL